uniref:Uncharacterized protein n=1 Tax=Oryza sativa subsp. japonica TaxID=39947 RepID=Q6ERT9_ORYSJ|nr:hypothetical protein [Oryza sativa Japonica Group]
MPGDGIARERFGEALGSSRTVLVRVVDELGPDDGARLRAAAETEQRRGTRRICGTELDEADAEAHAAIDTARQRGGSRGGEQLAAGNNGAGCGMGASGPSDDSGDDG